MNMARVLGAGLLAGIVMGMLVVFALTWYLVLPAIDPAMLKLNGAVFAMAHIMWGAALGLATPRSLERAGRLTPA